MPRTIERITRSLLRVAKHRVIEFLGIDSRPLNRALGRNRSQFLRGKILQLPAVPPKRRSSPTDNRNMPSERIKFGSQTG
jgi:hypothetical protein